MSRCGRCKEDTKGLTRCPHCYFWNTSIAPSIGQSVALEDIEATEEDRIISGPWDLTFGGGIVRDTLLFIGGGPGAGKSTFCLQLGHAIAKSIRNVVLYIASEESFGQIKGRADRLKVQAGRMIRLVEGRGEIDIKIALNEIQPSFVILDSLPGMVGYGPASDADAIATLTIIKDYATERHAAAIVIDHVNKEEEFAGRMALQHLVDATFMLLKDVKDENHRVLKPVKNRHGAIGKEQETHFYMNQNGLVHSTAPFTHWKKGEDNG